MSLARFTHRRGESGNDLEDIADNPIVGHLEDRSLPVLVDGDDCPRRAHAGEMLDRSGDAERYVQIRTDDASRLPDLIAVRPPSIVAHRPGATHRGTAKGAGELLGEAEILR